MASVGDFDRRTDMQDFVNSICQSTYDKDFLAYEPLPNDVDAKLISESIGVNPSEIATRASMQPYLIAIENFRTLFYQHTPIDKLRVVAQSSRLIV